MLWDSLVHRSALYLDYFSLQNPEGDIRNPEVRPIVRPVVHFPSLWAAGSCYDSWQGSLAPPAGRVVMAATVI